MQKIFAFLCKQFFVKIFDIPFDLLMARPLLF